MLSLILLTAAFAAETPGRIEAHHVAANSAPTADPTSADWKNIIPVIATNDRYGKPVPGHRTEIRIRWSDTHLYLLYTCPFEKLNLIAKPTQTAETDKLWDYDVAELFLGSDLENIHLYKEFEISPQGEWVDLDIDRKNPKPQNGRPWDSGFEVKTKLDREKKIWYGEMKIPLRAIADKPVTPGTQMRINLYRIQGPQPDRTYIAWQPVNNHSFHTPQAFGKIVFVK